MNVKKMRAVTLAVLLCVSWSVNGKAQTNFKAEKKGHFALIKMPVQLASPPLQKVSGPSLTKLFHVTTSLKIQSIAYANGVFYVGVITPKDLTIIYKYDIFGQELGRTGILPISHAASLSANPYNGHLYVTNGGGNRPTKVYEVDFGRQQILTTINLSGLGHSGVAALDAAAGHLWVETAPHDFGAQTFSYCDLNGHVIKQFSLTNQGRPQGIDYRNNLIYLYTDKKISVISTNGNVLRLIKINEPGESEGMVILPTGSIVVGFSQKVKNGYSNDFFLIKGFQ